MKKKILRTLLATCLVAGSFLAGRASLSSHAIDEREIESAYITGDELTLELSDGGYFQYYMGSRYVNVDSESFKKNYLDLAGVESVEQDGEEINVYLEDGNWYTLE